MCGRYLIVSSPAAIRAMFGYPEMPNFPPRHNVAPTQPIPIVRMWQGQRQFTLVRWGLLPPWVKDPKAFTLLINARADTVLDKPSFRAPMLRRRCLIPADGFYEWKADGARKRPYAILPAAGGPVAFAGLWEVWVGPNGEELETAAIVTTEASRSLHHIHHRMPVVIPPEAFDQWLDCANVEARAAASLLMPAPEDFFVAHEISTAVNRVANDSPELLTPVVTDVSAETATVAAPAPAAKRQPARAKSDNGQGSLF
jgi:putative SOS response-associated peptidase YedK